MRRLALALATALIAGPAAAHEFWIAPLSYGVGPGDALTANIRVGESFKGNAQSYFGRRTERFDIVMGDQVFGPEATLGDRPVLNRAVDGEGLAIVVFETGDSRLTYREWEKFVAFVDHKAFPGALERHVARGLPDSGFVETYRRYAKSLIAVGSGAGADRAVGLDTEIVALANPYTDAITEMPVRVTLYGAPRVGAQVEVYEKAPDEAVSVMLFTTDADGVATIPVQAGHEYMVDAVALEEREGDAAWHTMWANLTFAVPTGG
ncbi:MAG: DUF4198 domain-containing protein [Pseudomonadota bacterium]